MEKLCYVEGAFAYFTTQNLQEQWGDDWDDPLDNSGTPYTPCWHNDPVHMNNPLEKRGWRPGTQTPYEPGEMCQCESCKRDWNLNGTPAFEITKVAWEGPFELPDNKFSVQQINRGDVAWLRPYSYLRDSNVRPIPAGVSIAEFTNLIYLAGGQVYTCLQKNQWDHLLNHTVKLVCNSGNVCYGVLGLSTSDLGLGRYTVNGGSIRDWDIKFVEIYNINGSRGH